MSRIIVPSRRLWTPPQRQRGVMVLDAYRFGGGSGSTLDPTLMGAALSLSNGNRDAQNPTGFGYNTVYGTAAQSAERSAFEFKIISISGDGRFVIGIADKTNASAVINTYLGDNSGPFETLGTNDYESGRYYKRMTIGSVSGNAAFDFYEGHVITVDVDMETDTCSFYRNGTLLLSVSITPDKIYYPAISIQGTGCVARFFSKDLAYLPSGAAEWG